MIRNKLKREKFKILNTNLNLGEIKKQLNIKGRAIPLLHKNFVLYLHTKGEKYKVAEFQDLKNDVDTNYFFPFVKCENNYITIWVNFRMINKTYNVVVNSQLLRKKKVEDNVFVFKLFPQRIKKIFVYNKDLGYITDELNIIKIQKLKIQDLLDNPNFTENIKDFAKNLKVNIVSVVTTYPPNPVNISLETLGITRLPCSFHYVDDGIIRNFKNKFNL